MQQLTLCLALLLFPLALLAQEETGITPDTAGANKILEEMPRFPGCENLDMPPEEKHACAEQKLVEYVFTNLKYPPLARENGIVGTVVVSFVVERDGTLSNIRITRDIGAGCGEEVKRIIEQMNTQGMRWTPGKSDGEAVRVSFDFPVKFKLEGGGGKKKERKKRG
jgi:protein TonB